MHTTFESELELLYLDLRELHDVAAEGVRAIDSADGVRGSRIALRAIMLRIETMIAAGQRAESERQAAKAALRALSERLRGR